MNEETTILAAKYYLGRNSPRDYADWAVSCLENGLDTKNIRILASMFNADSFSDINIYFQRALEELGLELPPKEESLLSYSKFIAKQIVENKIEPVKGCREIYLLSYGLDYSEKLSNWIYLDEGLDPKSYEFLWDSYRNSEPTQAIKDAIVREAKELLQDDYFSRISQKTTSTPIITEEKNSLFGKIWKKFFS